MILSLFGALVLVASLYDAYKPRDDDESEVASDDVSDGVAFKMTTMSSPQPPAYHVNVAYVTSESGHSDVNVNNNNAGDVQAQKDVGRVHVVPEKTVNTAVVNATTEKNCSLDFKKEDSKLVCQKKQCNLLRFV